MSGAWTHVWDEATKRMNQSVENRNAALEKQGGIRWDNEQRQMMQGLEQGDLMKEMLRARIDRMRQPMPDFYGSGPTYSGATGWDNILREAFAKRGGGMDRRGGGGMNALAQILGGA